MDLIRKIARTYRILKVASSSIGDLTELPTLDSLAAYLAPYEAASLGLNDATALDLGCGTNPKNPFKASNLFGLDIRENTEQNIRYADLTLEPIPFQDESFDYITAYDFLEHIPRVLYAPQRKFPFVDLMSEIWRTLKPRGIFLSHTPIYPYSPAFRDPTHVNILTHETFPLYFDGTTGWAHMYGFRGSFEILRQAVAPPHLISLLRKEA